MVFWNENFAYESEEQNQCKNCHKQFGQLNDITGEITDGDVVQCNVFKEYCIGCCDNGK